MSRTKSSSNSSEKKSEQTPDQNLSTKFPIVGIGASAGGLEAFEQFFRLIPVDTGMAFILVPHLDPDHESMLADILGRVTTMPVVQAHDQMEVQPNHVYIIAPNREMSIFHRQIQLSIPTTPKGQQMKIDHFFRSLAEEQGDKAIGIVFSGTGTDGTLGLRAIQGAGGITFVQDPKSAKYDGMPTSAIASGYATYVLTVEEMPTELIASVRNLFLQSNVQNVSENLVDIDKNGAISRILRIIRTKTGHDFSQYKRSTIHRRIARRMSIHVIEDTAVYARYLEEHPDEVKTLFRELLINVTSFFRDPVAYDILKADILPEIIKKKEEFESIRLWVPGCSTGEEAYSLSIIIREILDDLGKDCKVQIYSTDLAEDVIATARKGFYPPNIATDISSERLKKFFIREENGYQVKKEIREMIIYATQNIIKDPPFTKLDLISCRNLLIYLDSDLQSKLISTFHYALNPGGILFISSSESIGSATDLFKPIDRKWKIYETLGTKSGVPVMTNTSASWDESRSPVSDPTYHPKQSSPVVKGDLMRQALLQAYTPPSVITDEGGNLLYIHGDTGKFLRPAQGQMSISVVDMAREGLELDLRTAIFSAISQKKVIRTNNLQVRTNGGFESVDLEVRPIISTDPMRGNLIISFITPGITSSPEGTGYKGTNRRKQNIPGRVDELEQELRFTKENLQATVEEMQAGTEELKSTNEELQSTNEELQSTNEELETSREELQSVNEEMMTVNGELQAKIGQLIGIQNDMKNFQASTGIGTIFLDINLKIRQFTPEAAKIYKVVSSDIGRSLSDIKSILLSDYLIDYAQEVLESLIPQEIETQTIDKLWFLVRILPYRTFENVIDGVVISFIDITSRKVAEIELIRARKYAESIVDTIREPLIILDQNLIVKSASGSFYRSFLTTPTETEGLRLTEIGNGMWNIPEIITRMQTIIPEKTSFNDVVIHHTIPDGKVKTFVMNARAIPEKDRDSDLILLAIEDITRISGKDE